MWDIFWQLAGALACLWIICVWGVVIDKMIRAYGKR